MISMLRCFPIPATALALCWTMACAGRTRSAPAQSGPAVAPAATPPPPAEPASASQLGDPAWLAIDSASKTVALKLEVTRPAEAPSALINDHRKGEARLVVPVGWTVQWSWRNGDSASAHSLVVMVQREKIPLEGGRPAFTNAMTRMVSEGLPPGQTDQTTFVAEEGGWYWLMCGVPGHALAGEWLELRVDPEAKTASVFMQ
jgi:hypothetical protein